MKTRRTLVTPVACVLVAALGMNSEAAMARGFGGARVAVGGNRAVVGNGAYGAGRSFGGYSTYRGFSGYRGYSGGRYYGGGWGLGIGLGLGLFVATLPLYHSTLWWDHTPYYYADNTYYRYNTGVGRYETVAPPSGLQNSAAASPDAGDLFAYPKNGQSEEQQSKDKYDCYAWARSQSGFDPAQPGAGIVANQGDAAGTAAGSRAEYLRAQTACLEGRGYTVR